MENIKLVTYNIDGLPSRLDLKMLPWVFKPFVWIYKLFKKDTVIKINDNDNSAVNIWKISKKLSLKNVDIIGVQEDFNFHNELMSSLPNDYSSTKHLGGVDLSKLFSNTEWISHFPLPRFKADGLNLIFNKNKIKIKHEEIVRWKKSYGYISHANDVLTHKGFRFYIVNVNDEVDLDVYILHMDADFYNEAERPNVTKDINARENQLRQLSKFIIDRYTFGASNPIIVMGDTNSADKYEWDVNNIIDNFFEPINKTSTLRIKEAIPTNFNDVDKIFYINNLNSKFKLDIVDCYFDYDFDGLSDHKPLMAVFKIEENE